MVLGGHEWLGLGARGWWEAGKKASGEERQVSQGARHGVLWGRMVLILTHASTRLPYSLFDPAPPFLLHTHIMHTPQGYLVGNGCTDQDFDGNARWVANRLK